MKNLITASEAFDALLNGFKVLCRPVGDMLEFSELDQFPATIFAKSGFEFCIKLETIELAGITFTKPLTVDELKVGTEVFVINPAGFIEKHVYQGVGYGIVTMVDGGFAQRDLVNARLQYEALCKLLGGKSINDAPLKTTELETENKQSKKRSKKASQIKDEISVVEETTKDIGDALEGAVVITEGSYVSSSEDFLAPPAVEPDLKPEVNAQFEILLDAIRICQSEKELDTTCANLEKEGFTQEQIDQINLAKQERLTELDAKEIDAVKTIEMPANYKSLHQTIHDAKTPEEVNAVINYTAKWSEDQRNVLLREMHSRLAEINQSKQPEKEPPALILQLQHAPDLKTLDELELEIPSRHADVHKTLWNMAKKRRAELTVPVTSSPEPDYLLGDYP
ncbi:hypothetical protein HMPREF0012_01812 [Acinetobacter calcoaceticus RUH2202]|uniref:hypothetical protein n=1 Tax=Acinetobacter calcoaceticus TaxID=471 RepID=UPI0001BB53E8|nr:hypothetical protein [Acinetobacter calcoaceticus]EEY78943.1 hypothetical protein HMPREF0012_01812 [Acinetobacter calcoaceticus RUH2202]